MITAVQPSSFRLAPAVQADHSPAVDVLQRRGGTAESERMARLLASASPDTMIEALQVFSREMQRDTTTSGILRKKASIEDARRAVEQAVARAMEAANDKSDWQRASGTLATVAKVAAVVAAVASVVVTGGASAIAIIALAGTLISTFAKDINEAAGGNDTSLACLTYGGAALSIGAGAGSLVAGAASGAATAAQQTASATERVAAAVQKAALIVGATATGASAYTGYRVGAAASEETHALADETALRAQRKQMMREVDQLIDMLKEVQKSFNTALDTLSSAREAKAASDLNLSAGIRA